MVNISWKLEWIIKKKVKDNLEVFPILHHACVLVLYLNFYAEPIYYQWILNNVLTEITKFF